MTPDLIEKMARAICEFRIREIRRFDRTPEEIERQLSASVDYAWGGWVPEATTALSVALDAIGTELVEVLVQQADGHDHLRDLARRERDLTGAAIHAAEAAVSRSNARAISAHIAEMKADLDASSGPCDS